MNSLKQTIEDKLYSYDTDEFTPVFRDGELDNKAEFALYKAEQVAGELGHLAARTLRAAGTVGMVIVEHIAAEVE